MSAAQKENRLDYIDGIRAIAALLVVFHHMLLEIWESKPPPSRIAPFVDWLYFGHFCVDAFIVLSGYVLIRPVLLADGALRGGALGFYRRRALRIVPPYHLAMLLSLLLIWLTPIGRLGGTHWDISIPVHWQDIVAHLLFAQNLFPQEGSRINHSFWSIALECQIYLFFPLLAMRWVQKTWFTVAAASLAGVILYLLVPSFVARGAMPHYLTLFVFGMAASTFVERSARTGKSANDESEEKARSLAPLILFWLLSAIVIALCIRWKYTVSMDVGRHMLLLDLLFGVLMSSLLVHLGQGAGHLRRLLAWHPLVRVGAFSYSLYLIHAPFVALFFRLFKHLTANPTLQFALLIVVGSPAIVGLAYLFFWGCERPFMPGKPRTERQAEIAAAVSPAP